jgi:hypothetical protein
MIRRVLSVAALVALGAAAATWLGGAPTPPAPMAAARAPAAPAAVGRGFPMAATRDAGGGDLLPRVRELEGRVARETAERERLQARLDELTAQLAALGDAPGAVAPAAPASPAAAAAPAPDGAAPPIDAPQSELERALVAAGLDAHAAAEVKRHGDGLAMAEMYLRDQATRENWLDTPRFQEEMAAIEAQRFSVRDELGDEAYDRYLFALGRSNRIRVEDVMSDSPAADVGLQAGDLILRYGDLRVFAPDELVAQTRQGTPGERVRVEVIRAGELLTVEVPRGPLGLRIAATQSAPPSG